MCPTLWWPVGDSGVRKGTCPLGAARHDLGRYHRLHLTRLKPQGVIGSGT